MQPGIPSCFRDTSLRGRPGSFLGLSLKPSSRHKKATQPSKDNAQKNFLAVCTKSQAEIVGQQTPCSHQVRWLQQFPTCSTLPVAFWGSSLKQLWFLLLFCVFETRFLLAQAGLWLTLSPEITLNSCSSCLCFSSVGITCMPPCPALKSLNPDLSYYSTSRWVLDCWL